MTLNVFEILVLVSLIQGVLFALIILTQKTFKVKANKYLAYSILLLSYVGIVELIMVEKLHKSHYITRYFTEDVPWLLLVYIPMVIYFLKSTNHKLAKSKKVFLLMIPFFVFLVLFLLIIFHHEHKLIYWQFLQAKYRLIYDTEFYFSIVFNTVLCIASYFIIKLSNISINEKKWLTSIWFFHPVILIIWILETFLPVSINPFKNLEFSYPVWFGASIYVYWLIFKGLIQLKLAQDKSEIKYLLQNENFNKKSKEQEAVSENRDINKRDVKSDHFNLFLDLLEKEKLYRNPDLSRDIVAKKLNMSTGYLSQMISASVTSNFTSLINDYRVEDVKQMLLNSDFNKYSIVAIGLEAGFKSKSTFYSEFKKKTGYTPSQFKQIKMSPN